MNFSRKIDTTIDFSRGFSDDTEQLDFPEISGCQTS